MKEYLTFRRMITPIFIQLIFWIGVAAAVIFGLILLADEPVGGLLLIILGPLGIRIYAELLIVIFRINDNLRDIRRATVGSESPLPTAPGAAP